MSAAVIGIAVSRMEIRIVATRREEVLWVTRVPRERTATLSSEIEEVLATRPVELKRGARVIAVIGASESQLRPLAGLPAVRNPAELHAMISQNADRFFVRDGGTVRVSMPYATADGDMWASAIEERIISEIAAACRVSGVRFVGATAVAAILHHVAIPEPEASEREVIWIGEGIRTRVAYDGWTPRRVVRERATAQEEEGIATPANLPEGVEASHADAYAATRVRHRDSFVIGEYADVDIANRRSRIRSWLWGTAAVASIVIAMVAPGALAIRRAADARAHLLILHKSVAQAEETKRQLASATAELNLVARFRGSRRSMTLLLGELAMALPESTAIASLRIDSIGGNLSIITPHAAAAVEALSGMPGIHRVQVSGSMTRETANGIELERATVRFGFAPARAK